MDTRSSKRSSSTNSKSHSRSRSRSRHDNGSPSFSPIRSSTPLHGHQPFTTYHTNELNLFQGDTEQPIFHGAVPTLTNMVPIEPVDHDNIGAIPTSSGPSRPQIQDYNRVGGWQDGTYKEHGRIEEVLDDASMAAFDINKPLTSQLTGLSAMQSPLPATAPPPPRPRVQAFEIAPESPATLKTRLHHMLSDEHHTGFSPKHAPSSLSRAWTPSHLRNLTNHSSVPTGTLSPLNVFEPSRVSTPIQHHQSFVIPSTLPPELSDDDGLDEDDEDIDIELDLEIPDILEIPIIPSIGTTTNSPGHHPPHPFDSSYPDPQSVPMLLDPGEPVIRPIRTSRSPTPPVPSLPPTPPPKDTSKAVLDETTRRHSSSSNPKKRRRSLTPGKPAHPPPPPPKKNNSDADGHTDTDETASINLKLHPNDESIIAKNLSSIGNLSSVVRSISKGITTLTTTSSKTTAQSHIELCERVIESLSQVERALNRRREVPLEHWESFPSASRYRYERRLKSLERSLARLRTMSAYILGLVGPVGLGQIRLLEVVVDKLAKHHAKLQDVADKLNATFDRLNLRHLHKIASKHVTKANVCRNAYLEARETYFGKRSNGNSREL